MKATTGAPTQNGCKQKQVLLQQHAGDHYSRDTMDIRDDSSSDVNSSRTASISWKISNSRETSNMQQGPQGHLMLDARFQKQLKFSGNFVKTIQNGEKFLKKTIKKQKLSYFSDIFEVVVAI
jgi:hypothetical protein